MTRDDIIRMAREAGWTDYSLLHSVEVRRLEQFANLVAAYEREECAKAAIDYHEIGWDPSCAAAIRARGEDPKRHPGYIIGDHWLQAAYTRICTGETEDEIMTDYGWQRARGEK